MADPLSAASAIISLVDLSGRIARSLYRKEPDTRQKKRIIKFEIYVSLLKGIGDYMLSSGAMPDVARDCLLLCENNLQEAGSLLFKSESSKRKFLSSDEEKVEKAVDSFIDAVQLLRDLSNEANSRRLLEAVQTMYGFLENSQTVQREQLRNIELQIEDLRGLTTEDSAHNRTQLHADLDALAEKIRANTVQVPQWRPDTSDPFSFSATIICAHQDETEHTPARGKLDSGCDEDWLSTEIIERAGLKSEVRPIEDPVTYTAFGGQTFEPSGMIDVTWFASNAGLSRKTTFFVHDDVPFDMILGKVFIKEQSIFVFDKPALALRQGKFTQEEIREIEENARKKGATNEQLASIRRADDASSRERLRQQKAASRLTSPGTLTPNPHLQIGYRPASGLSLSRSLSIQSSQSLSTQPSQRMGQSRTATTDTDPSVTLSTSLGQLAIATPGGDSGQDITLHRVP